MKKSKTIDYKRDCQDAMLTVRDALDVINGKWKLLIIISIIGGNKRFREILRSIPKMSSKVLAKELKDLEVHQLVKRTEYEDAPIQVEYTATEYVHSLGPVIEALHHWGANHRKKIIGK
jgi:DNA-binding HxlR family transcriptional regulator